ncbi:MAG: thioredoxin [Clostridia bacterium]|nr:thioredoxin [Clostridia bacterium]
MAEIKITKENFEQEVLKADCPVLLDFWATWCGPCRMIAPIVEEIAKENASIKVGKVNVDEEEALAVAFGIESIPTILIIKEGRVTAKAVGFRSKAELLSLLA